jgi:hypothetical protein
MKLHYYPETNHASRQLDLTTLETIALPVRETSVA